MKISYTEPGEEWDVPVTSLSPGDQIVSEDATITVAHLDFENCAPYDLCVVGQVTRGYGRSKKLHRWGYRSDQVLPTVIRKD